MGPRLQEEAVDAAVPGGLPGLRVDPAAGHNGHIGVPAHIEVVIDQVVYVSMGDAGGDGNRLPHRFGQNANLQARPVGFALYVNPVAGPDPGAAAVLPDVVSAGKRAAPIGNQLQQLFGNLIHETTPPPCSRRLSLRLP